MKKTIKIVLGATALFIASCSISLLWGVHGGGGFHGGGGGGHRSSFQRTGSMRHAGASRQTFKRGPSQRSQLAGRQGKSQRGIQKQHKMASHKHGQHGYKHHHTPYNYHNWGWGKGWGWGLGLGLGAWWLLSPFWWQYQYWPWPSNGIAITIDNTQYNVPNTATTEDLEKVSTLAQKQGAALREELEELKDKYETLEDKIDETENDTERIALESKLQELDAKVSSLGKKIRKIDSEIVGPIETKLKKYTPTGKNPLPKKNNSLTSMKKENEEVNIMVKKIGKMDQDSWSDTESTVEGLKVLY